MKSKFELYDFEIPVSEKQDTSELRVREAIHNNWMAPTRRDVTGIRCTDKYRGNIVAVDIAEDKNPPTLGGYFNGLLEYGWGCFHYNSDTIYFGRILYNAREDRFYFKGRDEIVQNNRSIISDLDIQCQYNNKRQEKDVKNIKSTITDVWPVHELQRVNNIKPATGEGLCYIISFNVPEDKERDTTVSTRKCIDGLVQNNWVIHGIKTNMLFISPIVSVISKNIEYIFKGKNSMRNTYSPRACDRCEEQEFFDHYVTGEKESEVSGDMLPIFSSLCKSCFEKSDYSVVSSQKYYDDQRSKSS